MDIELRSVEVRLYTESDISDRIGPSDIYQMSDGFSGLTDIVSDYTGATPVDPVEFGVSTRAPEGL